MDELWVRIEAWLQAHAPSIFASLLPGASEEELRATEAVLGVVFPEDVRASYRRHNGQFIPEGQYSSGPSFNRHWELLPLDRMIREWSDWKSLYDHGEFADISSEPDGPVRADWWNPLWIPVAHDAGGNSLCLDFNPAPGGEVGQLVTVWHDGDDREVIAPGYRVWLSRFADALERGEYIFVEEFDSLMKPQAVEDYYARLKQDQLRLRQP